MSKKCVRRSRDRFRTPCGNPAVEVLNGLHVCAKHAAATRRGEKVRAENWAARDLEYNRINKEREQSALAIALADAYYESDISMDDSKQHELFQACNDALAAYRAWKETQ